MGDEAKPTPPSKPSRRRRGLGCLAAIGVLAIALWVTYGGGEHEAPGEVTEVETPEVEVDARTSARDLTDSETEILFGDMHVHTTFSADAFMLSLPLMGGEGAHPPADACDFARYCSGLDFFALTDHAEALTPEHWRESVESIRRCNAVAGDPEDPDMVAFVGFEWSQVGRVPEEHYGHKNVIFRDLADDEVPTRPIGAAGVVANAMRLPANGWWVPLVPIMEFPDRNRYLDLATFFRENRALEACPRGVDVHDLSPDCREVALTPAELFEKLDQWGFPALVIPHGTTWGFYTPPGYTWDKQNTDAQDDPERQRLIEVYSGHGNSEEYRPWRAVTIEGESQSCPEPSEGYEPCCHRAGEIIRGRCDDPQSAECERRVQAARDNYLVGRVAGHLSLPDVEAEEWGDCGQCTDCFNPSFNFRPAGSAQYVLARGGFEDGPEARHHVLGFIASSDNHTARPGTGYKEMNRYYYTESRGPRTREWRERVWPPRPPVEPESRALDPEWLMEQAPFRIVELERQASFFLTGGLVAVHSTGRARGAIWDALQRRQTYGTSGDRILLWFDLVDEAGEHPMGSEVPFGGTPTFRVRAAGSFEQREGCPDHVVDALGPERLENVCRNECWYPSDHRRRITRIEVVRIRPQVSEGEDLEALIEDTWRTYPCEGSGDVCTVEITDPEFTESGRDALYYVRAIQEPTMAVNAGNLRCEGGTCQPCWGDFRNPMSEDCLSENEERAWSSPIWLRFDAALVPPPPEEEPAADLEATDP
ncbi:MAG: DUF3604 domain-containing protein [Sandaracinaceae bacterium]|nr:DUF3604 domain-containing protein [Sandaracinaceae bacterium]